MPWQKLTLEIPNHCAQAAGEYLENNGALSVSFESAENEEIFEPAPDTTPLWQSVQLSALFSEDADLQAILSHLRKIAGNLSIKYTIETLTDQDWQKNCQDAFPARCFGEKLWICPSWHEPPDPTVACVLLDPGLAFGTGSHPTTALCLEWLARSVKTGDLVIDYGCGSGILAIAALKLGAKEVWAVDNDPQALEATEENAHRNHCQSSALHILGTLQTASIQADILLANILANPLIHLADHFSTLLKPRGKIALSGILPSQIESVILAYQRHNIIFSEPTIQEGWVRLEGKLSSC